MNGLIRILLASFILLLFSSANNAQSLCGTNPRLESYCDDACIVCDLNGVSLTTTHSIVGTVPPDYCTFIAHSMQWVGFVAGTPNVSFRVDVTGCTMGNSIELGVYETLDCTNFNLVSNCNTAMPVGSYNFSNTQPLKPGCYYYIVIDGNGPASCSFNVTVTAGSTVAPEPMITDPIEGKDQVCEGETVTYSVPNVYGACDYNWEITGGTVLGPTDQPTVTVLWDQPTYGEVCVTASNVCNSSDRVCKSIYIHPTPPEAYIGPFEICAGSAYPYNGRFYSAGIWPIMSKNKYGCDSTTILEVIEIPVQNTTIQEVVCYPDCYMLGTKEICKSGQYIEILQSQIEPYCDSIVVLDLEILHVEAEIYKDGDLSCNDTLVILSSDSSIVGTNGTFKRVWKNINGDSLGDGTTLEVCDTGYYILHLSLETARGKCEDSDTVFVGGSATGPQLEFPDTVYVCRGEALVLSEIPIRDRNGASVTPEFYENLPSLPSQKINTDTIYPNMARELGVFIDIGGCSDEGLLHIEILPNPLFSLPDSLEQCPNSILDPEIIPVNFTTIDSSGILWLVRDSSGLLDTVMSPLQLDTSFWIFAVPDTGYCLPLDSSFISVLPPIAADFQIPDSICVDDLLELNYSGTPIPNGRYFWEVNGTSLSGPGPISITVDSSGFWNISFFIERKGCYSDTIRKSLFVSESPQQIDLSCDVIDTTLFIRWNNDPWVRSYTGIPDPAGPQGQRLNDSTWVFRDLPPGTTIKFKMNGEGFTPCFGTTDSIECQVIFCPNVLIDIDTIAPVCLPDQSGIIDLSFRAPGISNLAPQWIGPGIIDTENGLFDPEIAGEGTHEIRLELRDSFCQYNGSTFITVYNPAPLDFTLPDSICLGDTILLSSEKAIPGYAIGWYIENADYLEDLGNGEILVSWDSEGQKSITVVQENSICRSKETTKSVQVIAPLPPLEPNCLSDYESISFSWNDLNNVASYRVTTLPSGSTEIVADNNYLVTGLKAGDSVTVVIEPIWDGPCQLESYEIKCKTLPCPSIEMDISPVAKICLNDNTSPVTLELITNAPSGGQISWSGPGVNSSGIFDPAISGPGSHSVLALFEIFGCSYSESITIEVNENPDISILGEDRITCADPESELITQELKSSKGFSIWETPTGKIQGDTLIATDPGWYYVTFTDDLTGCTDRDSIFIVDATNGPDDIIFATELANCSPSNSGVIDIREIIGGTPAYTVYLDGVQQAGVGIIPNLSPGIYQLEVEDANGCLIDTTIKIDRVLPLTLTLERDTVIERGKAVQLLSSSNRNILNYSWSPQVPCGDCPDPIVRPETDTRYFLTTIDEFGCIAEASVLIRVFQKSFFIPNAFTPNDDGVNDRFNVSGNDFVALVETMRIFDRWGNQICSLENLDPGNPDDGWDGTANNQDLNPGVYVYCLRIRFTDGSFENRCGDITLLR